MIRLKEEFEGKLVYKLLAALCGFTSAVIKNCYDDESSLCVYPGYNLPLY